MRIRSVAALGCILIAVGLMALAPRFVAPQRSRAGGPPPPGLIILVDTAADNTTIDGKCSLREAIMASNIGGFADSCQGSANRDSIRFDLGGGTPVINITSALPQITAPVFINGATGGATRIELRGPGAGNPMGGLKISAADTIISKLVLNGFLHAAVEISASNATLVGNYIGTDAGGAAAVPNAIGIDVSGATGVMIGGTVAGDGNVISGNSTGVYSADHSVITVQGNRIGTNAAGTAAVPNSRGVWLEVNDGSVIGGSVEGARNIISGNAITGVDVTASHSLQFFGNYIGVAADGATALGNGSHGIYISYTPDIGYNQVGGAGAGQGNTIAFNGGDGVRVDGSFGTTQGNPVRGNSIFSNAGKGIGNVSGGAGGVNPPIITHATSSSVGGSSCGGCTIDVYSDNGNQGRIYEGSTTAVGLVWSFNGSLTGPNVTATATLLGDTSEFSLPFALPAQATPTPTPTGGTSSPTPSPTGGAPQDGHWGDADCDGNPAIGDALKTARHLIGLSVSQTEPCPDIGEDVMVNSVHRKWGDVDCSEEVLIGDALKVARFLLGLSVSQTEPCPVIGEKVQLTAVQG